MSYSQLRVSNHFVCDRDRGSPETPRITNTKSVMSCSPALDALAGQLMEEGAYVTRRDVAEPLLTTSMTAGLQCNLTRGGGRERTWVGISRGMPGSPDSGPGCERSSTVS